MKPVVGVKDGFLTSEGCFSHCCLTKSLLTVAAYWPERNMRNLWGTYLSRVETVMFIAAFDEVAAQVGRACDLHGGTVPQIVELALAAA